MTRARLLPEELAAALRERGLARIEETDLVVLETDGTITVVPTVDPRAVGSSRLQEHMPVPEPVEERSGPAPSSAGR